MKFRGKPNTVIIDRKARRQIGRYAENGVFETTDPYYINKFKAARVPIVTEEAIIPPTDPKPETAKSFYCKTCKLPFDSQGDFLKHTRTAEHKAKKEEKK